MTVDVLAVGPHPDDVDLAVGGILHKLARQGYATGILDLTRGEMATRGSVGERAKEAAAAARILKVARRGNVGLPDGALANTDEQRRTLALFLRSFRPRILIAPYPNDRHPDHEAAHVLVRDANYLAGLSRFDVAGEPHRADHVYYYRVYKDVERPDLVIDISDDFETKLEALRAYRSQFQNPEYKGESTYVASGAFWENIRIRAEYWGATIGVTYGEGLYTDGPIGLDTLPGLKEEKCE